jgi:hypothetical protein
MLVWLHLCGKHASCCQSSLLWQASPGWGVPRSRLALRLCIRRSVQPIQIQLGDSYTPLADPWKFAPGDSPRQGDALLWASPAYDDTAWASMDLQALSRHRCDLRRHKGPGRTRLVQRNTRGERRRSRGHSIFKALLSLSTYSSHDSRMFDSERTGALATLAPFPYQSTFRVMYMAAATAAKLAIAPTSRAYASTRKST